VYVCVCARARARAALTVLLLPCSYVAAEHLLHLAICITLLLCGCRASAAGLPCANCIALPSALPCYLAPVWLQSIFPELHKCCHAFMRHKDILLSPGLLRTYGIEYMQVRKGRRVIARLQQAPACLVCCWSAVRSAPCVQAAYCSGELRQQAEPSQLWLMREATCSTASL
jgi:hypothetical protein